MIACEDRLWQTKGVFLFIVLVSFFRIPKLNRFDRRGDVLSLQNIRRRRLLARYPESLLQQ